MIEGASEVEKLFLIERRRGKKSAFQRAMKCNQKEVLWASQESGWKVNE